MIITSAKPFEEILDMLKDEDNIFIVGCNVCAAKLKTGGEPEVREMCRKLEESGKHVVGWSLPTAACSIRSYDSLVEKSEKINDASCVLVMGCGSGVSAVATVVDLPIYGSNNTLSLGGSSGGKLLSDQCVMCGDCTISQYGGSVRNLSAPKPFSTDPAEGLWKGCVRSTGIKTVSGILFMIV